MPDRTRLTLLATPLLALLGVAAAILLPAGAAPVAAQSTDDAACVEITVGWRICAAPAVAPAQPPGPCATGVAVPDAANNPGLVADCTALLAVKDALRGAGAPNWSAAIMITAWDGVTVSGTPPRVTELRLEGRALTGTIPAALGDLSELRWLHLDRNSLSGPIPSALGNLAQLRGLYLLGNQLTGAIPPELANLARLERLNLNNNRLTGPIPPELANLAQLRTLVLGYNRLTGVIPPALGGLAQLRFLALHENRLTGAIPPELGDLAHLTSLWLGGNRLTGAIPPELGTLARLGSLYLDGNRLTGAIPPELGTLARLEYLSLGGNRLMGAIPPELGSLPRLEALGLSGNRLTGAIPPGLADLPLSELSLSENDLTGCLPRPLAQVEHNDVAHLGLASCPLRSETLTYGPPITTGSVPADGDYAFLTDPHDLTSAITTYEGLRAGLREGNPIGLVMHQNAISGASQAAFYDLVEAGDLVEWREAADCWVRYHVDEVHADPAGDPPRTLLTIQVYSYAFTGCTSGPITTRGTRTFTWTPESIRTGTIQTFFTHGAFVVVPEGWTGTRPVPTPVTMIDTPWPPDPVPDPDLGPGWEGGVSHDVETDALYVWYSRGNERVRGYIYRLRAWPRDAHFYSNNPSPRTARHEWRVLNGRPMDVMTQGSGEESSFSFDAGVYVYDPATGVLYSFSIDFHAPPGADPIEAGIDLVRKFLPAAP